MATVVVGVDGARIGETQGWVAVTLRDGHLRELAFHPTFDAVLAEAGDAAVVGVDMPIGHDDPHGQLRGGRRACDLAAQDWLGPRRASVFLVPPLDLLRLPAHADAVREAGARGVLAPSVQLWNLRARLLDVDARAAKDPRIVEVHPEVAFQRMLRAEGKAESHLEFRKKTWGGLHERLELLHRAQLRPTRSFGGVGLVSPDDVLDATAVAWSAHRAAHGLAVALPAEPPADPATGRAVAIWA